MEYELIDLVDVDELQSLTDKFSGLIGTAVGIFDPTGKVIFGSGWYDSCTKFHRVHPVTGERCRKSDVAMLTHTQKGGDSYCLHECENGLMDTATPIVINGKYLGGLSTGQFFLKPPDMEFFARQADEFSFDKKEYLEAIAEIPVFSLEYVEQFMGFYHKLAIIIAETGHARLKQIELNKELEAHREHLEELVQQKTADLEREKVKAEQANRAKSVFLANMSHELRTPLNAILGTAQLMMRDANFPGEYADNLDILSDSGSYLLGLIDEVLEISKIEVGRISLNTTSFCPQTTFSVLDKLIRPRLKGKNLRIQLKIDQEMPDSIVSDEAKLQQLLVILIDNAIKYTDQGEISVQVSLDRGQSEKDDRLLISVKDTGIGIPAEYKESIFEHFFQIKTDERHRDGVGLGLSICRQYVELVGGDIEVESQVGEGSTFKLTLPFEYGDVIQDERRENIYNSVHLQPHETPPKILIVEDDHNSRTVFRQLHEQAGFIVLEARDGREAIERYIAEKPDLIWMDFRLPVMSGLEAVQEIRALEENSDPPVEKTPIISLTASAFEKDREELLKAGCDDFMSKPFNTQKIFEKYSQYLGVDFMKSVPELKQTAQHIQLDTLPTAWIDEFVLNAKKGKSRQLLEILEDIRPDHPDTATMLDELIKKYDFMGLIQLMKRESDSE